MRNSISLLNKMESFLDFKTVKTSLDSVIRNIDDLDLIEDAVFRTHRIVTRGSLFIKLYLLRYPETVLSVDFIMNVFRTVGARSRRGRKPKQPAQRLLATLRRFYQNEFAVLLPAGNTELSYTNLSQVLRYASKQYLTTFETNIKQNFVRYVERFVNGYWDKFEQIRRFRADPNLTPSGKRVAIENLVSNLRKVKEDLLNVQGEDLTSPQNYHAWIAQTREIVLPLDIRTRVQNYPLLYDLKANPQKYFPCMMRIAENCENLGVSVGHICPIRTSFTPKNIRLDTTCLIDLLPRGPGFPTKQQMKFDLSTERKDAIWAHYFETERGPFRKYWYNFHHMIETDGQSCSILFLFFRSFIYTRQFESSAPLLPPEGLVFTGDTSSTVPITSKPSGSATTDAHCGVALYPRAG